jgi:hypothetical protein
MHSLKCKRYDWDVGGGRKDTIEANKKRKAKAPTKK